MQKVNLLMEKYRTGNKIFIFGAGMVGIELFNELLSTGIRPTAFLDNKKSGGSLNFENNIITIEHPDYLLNLERGSFFICIALLKNDNYYTVRHQLETKYHLNEREDFYDFGFNDVICGGGGGRMYKKGLPIDSIPVEFTFDKRYKDLLRSVPKLCQILKETIDRESIVIPTIDIKITTHCTRNCIHCGQSTPLVEQKQHYDAKKICEDLDTLLSAKVVTPSLVLIGGEPMLHPQLPHIIEGIGNLKLHKNIEKVTLITNTTVVPTREFLCQFKELKKGHIILNVYEHYDSKLTDIIQLLEKAKINYTISTNKKQKFYDLGNPKNCRNRSLLEIRRLFAICEASWSMLCNGNFYSCSRAAALHEHNIIPTSQEDFVEINRNISSEALRQKLYDYLYNKDYINACNYCNGFGRQSDEIPLGR
jgi:hypothetical protein